LKARHLIFFYAAKNQKLLKVAKCDHFLLSTLAFSLVLYKVQRLKYKEMFERKTSYFFYAAKNQKLLKVAKCDHFLLSTLAFSLFKLLLLSFSLGTNCAKDIF